MSDNDAQEVRWAYERAERIVAEKVGFLRHLIIYVVVNALLFAINMVTSSGFLWFLIPLAGWGIVLLAHFLTVFTFRGGRFERWRKRQIEKEMEKLRGRE
ncbi:MAG: 2TM domain-containing protein [Dehalococcoidia bacterium]|nr:MAG: 2TM domain-containing protein [Dehalococcoidia bacterium]